MPQTDGGFIITHNRDEAVVRTPALAPKRYRINQTQVIFPQDPQSQGTWIATSARFTLCLLNGAFENHERKLPYRQSRGRIIPDFFEYKCPEKFADQYNFDGIEPFTLVIIDSQNHDFITEIKWDGSKLFQQKLPASQPKIWSSATLYNAEVRKNRETWFGDWVHQTADFEPNKIMYFHQNGGNGDRHNDMVMNRHDELKTQCIMQIEHRQGMANIGYKDLLSGESHFYKLI